MLAIQHVGSGVVDVKNDGKYVAPLILCRTLHLDFLGGGVPLINSFYFHKNNVYYCGYDNYYCENDDTYCGCAKISIENQVVITAKIYAITYL